MPLDSSPTQNWLWKYYKPSKDLTKYMIGMKKTWQENRHSHPQERTPKIYVIRLLAYVHKQWQNKFSLTNMKNTKYGIMTLAQCPNSNTPKLFSHTNTKFSLKTKVFGTQYQVWGCT